MPPKSIVTIAISTFILLFILCTSTIITGVSDSVVDFHADVLSGSAPLTIQFMDDTTFHRDAWTWDFGDGNLDHAQNPVHTYNNPGNYMVSLTILADGKQVGTQVKTDYIHVYTPVNTVIGTPGTNGQDTPSSVPVSASTIPAYTDTPSPPTTTATKATPPPTLNASGNVGSSGGMALSQDTIQLILAAAIAIVIALMIIYFFSNMNRRPGKKEAERPVSQLKPKPPSRPGTSKVKDKASKPIKKSEDISQDYIYGLVTGNADSKADQPRGPASK
jgi:PKD repeat protein